MKKIINGRVYDTETARKLGYDSYSNRGDFHHWCETLYQKRTGEFFLHGEGGPMTKYACRIEQNSWGWGEKIMPLSYETARKWAEEHMDADDYMEVFKIDESDIETLYVQLPAGLMHRLRNGAKDKGLNLRTYVQETFERSLS